jgi:cupin 2 domain-containing protein
VITASKSMLPAVTNLFTPTPDTRDELFATLVEASGFRLEHVVSNGVASPPGFWYDQEASEWVALVHGRATLEFEDGRLALEPGDSLLIPAHSKHRVADSSTDAIWLTLHFRKETES